LYRPSSFIKFSTPRAIVTQIFVHHTEVVYIYLLSVRKKSLGTPFAIYQQAVAMTLPFSHLSGGTPMLKKIVIAAVLVYALAAAAQADSTVSGSFNNKSKGSIHHNTYVNSSQSTHAKPPKEEKGADNNAQGTLVKANVHNEIKRAGNISSMIKGGNDNQANAASIAVNGNASVTGSLYNRVNTKGNITSMVKNGDNNQANAASISVNGAVIDGQIINDVQKTGHISAMVQDGNNNQANAASIAIQ
jgi:hypothetical protein